MSEPFRPTAYCVRCKAIREIADFERVVMRNGKEAFQGKCRGCGLPCWSPSLHAVARGASRPLVRYSMALYLTRTQFRQPEDMTVLTLSAGPRETIRRQPAWVRHALEDLGYGFAVASMILLGAVVTTLDDGLPALGILVLAIGALTVLLSVPAIIMDALRHNSENDKMIEEISRDLGHVLDGRVLNAPRG